MTPPEPNEARARMLFAACGFGIAALCRVAVLFALGLKDRRTPAASLWPPRDRHCDRELERERRPGAADSRAPFFGARGRIPEGPALRAHEFLESACPDPHRWTRTPASWSRRSCRGSARAGDGNRPWIGVGSGSTPVYRVPRGQPRVRVRLESTALHGGRPYSEPSPRCRCPPRAKPAPGPTGTSRSGSPQATACGSSSAPATPRMDGTHNGVARSAVFPRTRATTPAPRGRAPRETGGRRRAAFP